VSHASASSRAFWIESKIISEAGRMRQFSSGEDAGELKQQQAGDQQAVLDRSLARAWESGAGPGELPLVIDIDSFIGEVHGEQKQGASYGYTRQLGYHPIAAVRSDTGEVLHIRNRKGKANTQRGAARFV
jgi:Transposase DDE domain group 1